jgi:excisionase family DNA binding protein
MIKIKEAIAYRETNIGYLKITIETNESVTLPYVAGDYSEFIPESDRKTNGLEIFKKPLFNNALTQRFSESFSEPGIVYVELQKNYRAKAIQRDNPKTLVDLYYTKDKTLVYAFHLPGNNQVLGFKLKKESDNGKIWKELSAHPDDPIWRQALLKEALIDVESGTGLENVYRDLMTVKEVAAYLQLSEGTVRNYVSAKEIPFEKKGGSVRFRKSDIDDWKK